MIKLPMLTQKDMEIFDGKKVVLYSSRENQLLLYKVFRSLGINVLCGCTEFERSKWQTVKNQLRGFKQIKSDRLINYVKNYNNVIIQSVGFDVEDIARIKQIANQLDVEFSPIVSGQIVYSFSRFVALHEYNNNLMFLYKKMRWKYPVKATRNIQWYNFQLNQTPVVICSPQKTADHSIMYTFQDINASAEVQGLPAPIQYTNLWHTPKLLEVVRAQHPSGQFKIIMGVREPISQNISALYQRLSNNYTPESFLHMSWSLNNHLSRREAFEECDYLFRDNAGIVQDMFDKHMERCNNAEYFKVAGICESSIQHFVLQFQEHVLDIVAYPFDREKGYTSIKEGNIEVFVYQLEKLNNLAPELSEWIGVPFDKLINGNQASDKWIAESYKQAQKEIEITQEYFDKCFNEPYVKHCYSEADIEKFKARWRPHIKKGAQ